MIRYLERRYLLVLVTIAIATVAVSGVGRAASSEDQEQRDLYIERALRNSAPDPSLSGRLQRGIGTGFFVSTHFLLTNYHVVRDCAELTIEPGIDDHQAWRVELATMDKGQDLALLKSAIAAAGVALLEARLERADTSDLFIVGYPLRGMVLRQLSLTRAVARPGAIATSEPLFQFFADIHPGQSGSPLLDEYGAVVGVIARKVDTVATYQKTGRVIDQVGLAIPAAIMLDFLKQHHVPFSLASPPDSLSLADRLERARAYIARISCWQ